MRLNELAKEMNESVNVMIVILRHEGNYNNQAIGCLPFLPERGNDLCQRFRVESNSLKVMFASQDLRRMSNLQIDLIFAPSFGSLVQDVLNKLPVMNNAILVH